ncbi:uncharacterized protein LOC111947985 isoform X2 [Oryzias latipes]
MKCAFRKASERSVIRAPPPHSPGNPRMNPQENARLKNSWTAGRPQDHGEGLFCIEDGGGNVTWSPQRILEMGDVEQEPGCEGSSLSKDAHTSLSSSSSWGTPGPAERRSLPSVSWVSLRASALIPVGVFF